MTNHRKDRFRQDLGDAYKHLCDHSNPVTDQLFGDDLSKQIKDLGEEKKLVSRLADRGKGRGASSWKPYRGARVQPYYKERRHQRHGDYSDRFLQPGRRPTFKKRPGFPPQNKH